MVKTSPPVLGVQVSIPGQGTQISHMPWVQKSQNLKQKQSCNKFNKDFKNGPSQKKNFFFIFGSETFLLKCTVIIPKFIWLLNSFVPF